jgi:hypothetical protein
MRSADAERRCGVLVGARVRSAGAERGCGLTVRLGECVGGAVTLYIDLGDGIQRIYDGG